MKQEFALVSGNKVWAFMKNTNSWDGLKVITATKVFFLKDKMVKKQNGQFIIGEKKL